MNTYGHFSLPANVLNENVPLHFLCEQFVQERGEYSLLENIVMALEVVRREGMKESAKSMLDRRDKDMTLAGGKKEYRDFSTRMKVHAKNKFVTDGVGSLSIPLPGEEGHELLDVLHGEDSPENNVTKSQYGQLVSDFLLEGGLNAREKEVFTLRFGLCGGVPMIHQDIADRMGLSRETVRTTDRQATVKCREYLATRKFSARDL